MTTNDVRADLWEGFEDIEPEQITGPAWDEPVPLRARPALPDFPVHAFPAWLGSMVRGVAEETQTPADLAGWRSWPPPPADASKSAYAVTGASP